MTILNYIKCNSTAKVYSMSVIYKIVCVALAFLNSVIINRCLGVALRGEYTTITTYASLIQLVANLGIGTAYPAFKRKYPNYSRILFSTYIFALLCAYSILFIPFLFFSSPYTIFLCLLTLSMAIGNIIVFIAIVEDVKKRNKINILTSVFHTIVLLIIFVFYARNLYFVLASVILDHLILSLSFVYIFKLKHFDYKIINRKNTYEILSIGLPAMLMNMLMYLNYHADVIFLSFLQDSTIVVGLYGTGVTLGNMLWIIPDAFKDVVYNRSAKKDNPEEILIIILLNSLLCIFIVLGFCILGKWFLVTMYGDDFVDAYMISLLIFMGTFPMILYKLIHPIYIANGKTKIVVLLLLLAVVINIVFNFLLIPPYGAYGAAIASIISYSICGIAFLVIFIKDYNINVMNLITKRQSFLFDSKRRDDI